MGDYFVMSTLMRYIFPGSRVRSLARGVELLLSALLPLNLTSRVAPAGRVWAFPVYPTRYAVM